MVNYCINLFKSNGFPKSPEPNLSIIQRFLNCLSKNKLKIYIFTMNGNNSLKNLLSKLLDKEIKVLEKDKKIGILRYYSTSKDITFFYFYKNTKESLRKIALHQVYIMNINKIKKMYKDYKYLFPIINLTIMGESKPYIKNYLTFKLVNNYKYPSKFLKEVNRKTKRDNIIYSIEDYNMKYNYLKNNGLIKKFHEKINKKMYQDVKNILDEIKKDKEFKERYKNLLKLL